MVEKQILWSKRCKDESLRGTVKETITQVSSSKKWESKPVLDENGNPMLNANGKKILKSSYSCLLYTSRKFPLFSAFQVTDLPAGAVQLVPRSVAAAVFGLSLIHISTPVSRR